MSEVMTAQEAIRRVKEFDLHHVIEDMPSSVKTAEAFQMAINALSAYGDIVDEINNLAGDSFPNSYYIKIINKHLHKIDNQYE